MDSAKPETPASTPGRPAARRRPQNPYPGLRAFEDHEARIFFGRDRHIDEILERLATSHFVPVIGPSGCGKSSLIRAGVVPALRAGRYYDAGSRWHIAVMRPENSPIWNLANVLHGLTAGEDAPDDFDRIRKISSMLLADPDGIEDFRLESGLGGDENILLVIDQFEELFNIESEAQQDATDVFISIVLNIYEAKFERIHCIITMRTDNLGDCARYTGLADAINRTLYLTPNLTPTELREAVELPAIRFGGTFEDGLIERVLNDMASEVDQLPLMQHVMRRIWTTLAREKAEPPVLTHALYESFGRIADTVNHHARDLVEGLDEEQKALVPGLFRQLTERRVGGAHQDVRHPSLFKDLALIAGIDTGTGKDLLRSVVDHCRAPGALFLRPQMREHAVIGDDTRIDIVHECLIRKWNDLRHWVELESKSVHELRDLDAQAARSRERGTEDEQGPAGAGARDAAGQRGGDHTPWLNRFIGFGGRYLDREATEELLRWRRRESPNAAWAARYGIPLSRFEQAMEYLDLSQVRHRRRKFALSAAVAAVVMALTFGPVLWLAQSKQARRDAISRAANKLRLTAQIMSPDMPVNALDLWRAEVRSADLEKLGQTYAELGSWVAAQRTLERDHLNLMIVPDAGADYHNAFSPLELPIQGRPPGPTEILSVDVSPDGSTWAILNRQGVRLVDRTGKAIPGREWQLPAAEAPAEGSGSPALNGRRHLVAFHRSGKAVHVISDGRVVRRIPVGGGEVVTVRSVDGDIARSALSADGGRLAVVRRLGGASEENEYEIEIIDLLRNRSLSTFRMAESLGELTAISFDAEAPVLALAFDDTHITLWKPPESGTEVLSPYLEFRSPVTDISRIRLSPDGEWLAGIAGVIGHLWRLSDIETLRGRSGAQRPIVNPTWSLYGHSLPFKLLRFLGDGSLLTMRENGDTRIWRYERSLFSRRLIQQPQQPQFETVSATGLYSVIDRNGAFLHRALRRPDDSRIDIWELDNFATKAAISHDGAVVAVGYEDGTLALLAPKLERETRIGFSAFPVALEAPAAAAPGEPNRVAAISLSNDGSRVAALRADGTVVTAVRDPDGEKYAARVLPLEGVAAIGGIALSPRGNQLAVLSEGRLLFYFRKNDEWVRRPESAEASPGSPVCSFAYSRDGRNFAVGTIDGTLHVADIIAGRIGKLGSAIRSFPDSSVASVVFGRSGPGTTIVSTLFESNAARQPCRGQRREAADASSRGGEANRGVKVDVTLIDGTPVPEGGARAHLRTDELMYRDAAFLPGSSTLLLTDVNFLGRSSVHFFDLVPARIAALDIADTLRGEIAVETFLDPANYFVDQRSGTGLPDWFPAQMGCGSMCWMIARTGLRNRLLVAAFHGIEAEAEPDQ